MDPVATPAAPPSAAQVLETIKSLAEGQKALQAEIAQLKAPAAPGTPGNPAPTPFVRRGEDPLTSRGFSFVKMFGAMANVIPADNAKVELDLCKRLNEVYSRQGYAKQNNSAVAPFSSQFIAQTHKEEGLAREVGEVVRAGVVGYDREEVMRLRGQYWGREKALSWVDETQAGALVGPPQMGELVELLRNNEIFMRAGARTIAMPPNGRIQWPRQTGASTAYWVGMDANDRTITDSNPTTGDITLQAKKLGILVKIPNELFRFSSISIEQFVREDMSRVLALKLDKTLLDGAESAVSPKGLINYANIANFNAGVTGTDGDTFQPEDVAKAIGTIEEQNAIFRAWVMRPLMYSSISNRRADAVTASDGKGMFLFNILRTMQEQYVDPTRLNVGQLEGYQVFKSTQVSNTRAKGSATNLTYILFGDFADYLVAMSGTMEFMISQQGDTPFTQDQTWFRGILHCDGAPRHEASFGWIDNLVVA